MKVASGATFPTQAPFTVIVGDEHIQVVGGVGTTTWTVVRGADNTTKAAHAVNAQVVTASQLSQAAHNTASAIENWFNYQTNKLTSIAPVKMYPPNGIAETPTGEPYISTSEIRRRFTSTACPCR